MFKNLLTLVHELSRFLLYSHPKNEMECSKSTNTFGLVEEQQS